MRLQFRDMITTTIGEVFGGFLGQEPLMKEGFGRGLL